MSCDYIYVQQPSPEDLLNWQRNQDLARLEQELGVGTATIEVDPITGVARIVGGSVAPEGMGDLCVLDALAQRGSLEFQLAAAHASVQERNFTTAHAYAHQHGHKH
jgi:hypothetical protein